MASIEARVPENVPGKYYVDNSCNIRQKKLGPEHPATVRALSNLADANAAVGHFSDAISAYRRPGHPAKTPGIDRSAVQATMSKLASNLRKTGQKRETKALETHSKALLADH